jgi:uncharacterized protein (DUF362 family)/NAD-dependent dihydropyrimidine dehydrogenase PreA subunit
MKPLPVVAAAFNAHHTNSSVYHSLRHILDKMSPSLSSLVRRGDRVLVKVNMGCSGSRAPESRLTTHPVVVEAIINALLDCGATVYFGDDVARSGRYREAIYRATGMLDVSKRTGAKILDFVASGAREVRGGLTYPRRYLVTNAYFDADLVVNAASCRSHVGVGMSGAIKNMFGCVVGLRKQLIHNLFPGDPRSFGRVIADIYRTIPANVSFLDLTTVAAAAGISLKVCPVGLILGSTDAVALDTVAAHAIGYEDLMIWPSHFAAEAGVGCNRMEKIGIRGVEWDNLDHPSIAYPYISPAGRPPLYHRVTARLNHTLLRPRPVVDPARCVSCGDCVQGCPVGCISAGAGKAARIDLSQCVDCGCCIKTCELGAVQLQFGGFSRLLRLAMNRSITPLEAKPQSTLDPFAIN